MATIQGQQGMTKAKKREARLASMFSNRKRDKSSQRSRYHNEFKRQAGKRGYHAGNKRGPCEHWRKSAVGFIAFNGETCKKCRGQFISAKAA